MKTKKLKEIENYYNNNVVFAAVNGLNQLCGFQSLFLIDTKQDRKQWKLWMINSLGLFIHFGRDKFKKLEPEFILETLLKLCSNDFNLNNQKKPIKKSDHLRYYRYFRYFSLAEKNNGFLTKEKKEDGWKFTIIGNQKFLNYVYNEKEMKL